MSFDRSAFMSERNTTHGMSDTQEYKIWKDMKKRCNNKKNKRYANYGAKGIKVAPEWENDFPAFYNHIGPRPTRKHSVGRIDNNLGYQPGNVRWETPPQQARNHSRQSNNTSGVTGVSVCVKVIAGNTYTSYVACATIPKELSKTGKKKKIQKYFSIDKFGAETALQMATQWREEKLAWLAEQGVVYAESHGASNV